MKIQFTIQELEVIQTSLDYSILRISNSPNHDASNKSIQKQNIQKLEKVKGKVRLMKKELSTL
jgi:hypothetical protein